MTHHCVAEVVVDSRLRRRFWRKVKQRGPDDCWLWTGATDRRGYGVVSVRVGEGAYRNRMARRIAYELEYGRLADGVLLLSTCDHRWCVNPDHHYPGNPMPLSSEEVEVRPARAIDILDRVQIIRYRRMRRATLAQLAQEMGYTTRQVKRALYDRSDGLDLIRNA